MTRFVYENNPLYVTVNGDCSEVYFRPYLGVAFPERLKEIDGKNYKVSIVDGIVMLLEIVNEQEN